MKNRTLVPSGSLLILAIAVLGLLKQNCSLEKGAQKPFSAGSTAEEFKEPDAPGHDSKNARTATAPEALKAAEPRSSHKVQEIHLEANHVSELLECPPGTIRSLAYGLEGEIIQSGSPHPGGEGWLIAMRINGPEGYVFTLAKEPGGMLIGRIYSVSVKSAWSGRGMLGDALFLKPVDRDDIRPVCAGPPAGGGVSGNNAGQVPLRQSLAGALKVLYLDFDGENVSNTTWNAQENGGNPILASHSGLTTAEIERVWQETAEDFRPFEVNVTTDPMVYQGAFTGFRMMAVITQTDEWYNWKFPPDNQAGGVAYLNSFGFVSDRVCWVFSNKTGSPSGIAMAVSHEFGHTLNLGHYGVTSSPYYHGHGTGAESWGPLMGAPYQIRLTQWSNGDYPNAKAQFPPQDDISVLAGRLTLRTDEDANTPATARNLHPNTAQDTALALTLAGDGVLHSRSDLDFFSFDAPGPGQIQLVASPFASGTGTGANLNLKARLLNASAAVLVTSAPLSDPAAPVSFPVTAAGRFFLEVDGVGRDGVNGFSDYGSIGCYVVKGTFTATGPPVISRQPSEVQRVIIGGAFSLSVQASGGAPLNYQWQRRATPSAAWLPIGQNQPVLSYTSSSAGENGQYRVMVSNGSGSATSQNAVVTVGTVSPDTGYLWKNFAGKAAGKGSADGVGVLAQFVDPGLLHAAADGTLLIPDGNGLRRMHRNGVVETIYRGAVGSPVRDPAGNILFAGNGAIRKLSVAGVLSTVAGMENSPGFANGPAANARFNGISAMVMNSAGVLFVSDSNNNVIRRIDPSGNVTTFAGSPGVSGSADGNGAGARFYDVAGLAVDAGGNLFVADRSNHTIRKITPAAEVTTFAGRAGFSGGADGAGINARFRHPNGVAVDTQGRLWVADTGNHIIRRIDGTALVTTVAGQALAYGYIDGPASVARFGYPSGIAAASDGNITISDSLDYSTIRRISPGGIVATIAGSNRIYGSVDGAGEAVRFSNLRGIKNAVDGTVFLTSGHAVKKILPHGETSTVAGDSGQSGSSDGSPGSARFNFPTDLAVTATGNIYVTDTENATIRRIAANGAVSTFAGSLGNEGYVNGTGTAARFAFPEWLAADTNGNLFLTERNSSVMRKITPTGVVSSFAGNTTPGLVNGQGPAARFSARLGGVACDALGNVYVSDTDNYVIRKITPGGLVSTFSGTPGVSGSVDGPASLVRFKEPGNLAVDVQGNILLVDGLWYGNNSHTIRKIRPDGHVTTIGGTLNRPGHADGIGQNALFSTPSGIAVTSGGTIYVTEDGSGRVRIGTPALNLGSNIVDASPGTSLPDSDGDGVSDAEENLVGTNPFDPLSFLPVLQGSYATQDSDGDGMSDAEEEIAGTNPTDREDVLGIKALNVVPGSDGQSNTRIVFSARPDRAYWLQAADTLTGSPWSSAAGPLTVTEGAASITVVLPQSGNRRFFRVKVLAPGGS